MGAAACSPVDGWDKCSITLPADSNLAKLARKGPPTESTASEGPQPRRWSKVRAEFLSKTVAGRETMSSVADVAILMRKRQEGLVSAARAGDFRGTVDAASRGADVHAKNLRGQTPLMLAVCAQTKGAIQTVNFLLDVHADLESRDENGWTPLLHACRNSRVEVVNLLLSRGASVGACARDGKSAAILAAMDGADQLTIFMLDRKVAIEKKDENGWPVLFFACGSNYKLTKHLLTKKANPNERGKDRETAFMISCESGALDTAKLLLKWGSSLNASNNSGDTALILALRNLEEDTAKWLIEERADVSIKNQSNEDAIIIADRSGLQGLRNTMEARLRFLSEHEEHSSAFKS